MQVTYLLHAEPAKLGAAQGARHVITRTVIHLGNEHLTPRARFNVITLSIFEIGRRAINGRSLGAGSITGLVRVPQSLAMVTKRRTTSRALTQQARTTGTTGSQNNEIAVGSRTPTRIRIGSQNPSQHEILVFFQKGFIIQYQSNVVGMHGL